MIALAIPPGHARAFGFERLAGFDHRRWNEVARRGRSPAASRKSGSRIFGRDRYGEELKKSPPQSGSGGPCRLRRAQNRPTFSIPAPRRRGRAPRQSAVRRPDRRETALAEFYPKLGDTLKTILRGLALAPLFSGIRGFRSYRIAAFQAHAALQWPPGMPPLRVSDRGRVQPG